MKLSQYLQPLDQIIGQKPQQEWFRLLIEKAESGMDLFGGLDKADQDQLGVAFNNKVRTEELKAWYGEPEGDSLFQGTSVTSLTIPHITEAPVYYDSVATLEDSIVEAYIAYHDKHAPKVQDVIQEDTGTWIGQGLYYGVAICSKVISQAFDLTADVEDVIFTVDNETVDPHEITSYSQEVRWSYFEQCKKKIQCFEGLELEQKELESSLVTADISKPKINDYKNKILLGPIKCNEIATMISMRVVEKIRNRTSGRINPTSLAIIIYDTDTPYTYHQIMGYIDHKLSPVLPGLILLGSSGTIDAFKWLYVYRVSLVAQKIQKSSLYSQVHSRFMPFVFMGVLVWRDAEILLDMEKLSLLRYRGNINPYLEFSYLLPSLYHSLLVPSAPFDWSHFKQQHLMQD